MSVACHIVRGCIARLRADLERESAFHLSVTARVSPHMPARDRVVYELVAATSLRLAAAQADALKAYERIAKDHGIAMHELPRP